MKSESAAKPVRASLKPFVQALPDDSSKFTQLLKEGQSLKMQSGYVVLQPEEEVGSHNSDRYEELIIILEGEGVFEAEPIGRQSVSKGLIAYNPPGTQHNIINTGKSQLRYIFIVSEAF